MRRLNAVLISFTCHAEAEATPFLKLVHAQMRGVITDQLAADGEPLSGGGGPLGEIFVQQRRVQDVHRDAEGARQPELLPQPRAEPDPQEAPLADLVAFEVISQPMQFGPILTKEVSK